MMNFGNEDLIIKSGWLTKLGGNAIRKTWKRRWFVLKGNNLYYYRDQNVKEASGVINLSLYNSISQDTTITKKSQYCIRIEKVIKETDSIHSNLKWMTLLEKRLGDRNIVDIVLDRLDLANIGMHKRQGSYSSLRSFYSKNSSFCSSGGSTTTNSNLSSRRPSLDSLSLDTPPLDSRKSSMDSFRGNQNTISHNTIVNNNNSDSFPYQSISRPETPSNLVALFGIGQPILRKPASHGCLQDKHIINSINNSSANNNVVYFLGNDDNNNVDLNDDEDSLITPLANVFPSHLTDKFN
nr:3407_t:CDS:2 [Entrophospora candida]